jgi:hypothetical protein
MGTDKVITLLELEGGLALESPMPKIIELDIEWPEADIEGSVFTGYQRPLCCAEQYYSCLHSRRESGTEITVQNRSNNQDEKDAP